MDANLKSRLATAGIGIPIFIWLVGRGPPWLFAAVFLALTVGALCEFFSMALPQSMSLRYFGIAVGFALALTAIKFGETSLPQSLALGLIIIFSSALLLRWQIHLLPVLPLIFTGAFYVGYLVPFLIVIFYRADGRAWVAWLVFVIMAGDSAAYFVGRKFGRMKLAPNLSPGKTVAGAYGYVAGAVVVGMSFGIWLLPNVSSIELASLSCIIGIVGQVSDLFESYVKRLFVVKDSGTILPGHGGLLDRLDSLIFPAVLTSNYLRIFHP